VPVHRESMLNAPRLVGTMNQYARSPEIRFK
jgi:hypothetical protein